MNAKVYDLALPPPSHYEAPDFVVPALACDTHAHVISADTTHYPFTRERSYTPAPASETAYFSMLDALHLERGVLVQVSVYGVDNRLMLDTLERHPQRLRGVVVLSPSVSDAELDHLHELGVRGVRINTQLKGGIGLDHMHTLARRIQRLGWHMQFFMHASEIRQALPELARLPVPCVLDHMGGMRADSDEALVDDAVMLVREHGWWVKLSGAYRLTTSSAQKEAVADIARALIAADPERMVWGTDWPHVHIDRMPDTGMLLNQFRTWIDDDRTLTRILVENPARLYGF